MSRIADIETLEERLSKPTDALVERLARVEGDIMVLGVAGKMGPSLARMALRAGRDAGTGRRVVGVSRFSDPSVQQRLQDGGIETIQGDLLDPGFVQSLPDVPNIVYMAGKKFGTAEAEPMTWASNTYLPAIVCRRFERSRMVAFSTGNVYPQMPIEQGRGSVETDGPAPLGEYAMSCLGRERMFEYFSEKSGTRIALVRLNYAAELRYGVLVDLAQKVYHEQEISLAVGYANVIWQGDANAFALCMLADASSPPLVLNVTGPEQISCRRICEQFGQLMGKPVRFSSPEGPTALLSDASLTFERYGMPRVAVDDMVAWTADWIVRGGATYGKPTHYEVVDGKF